MKLVLNKDFGSQLPINNFTRSFNDADDNDGLYVINIDIAKGVDTMSYFVPYVSGTQISEVKVLSDDDETLFDAENLQASLTSFTERISETWYDCSAFITIYAVNVEE